MSSVGMRLLATLVWCTGGQRTVCSYFLKDGGVKRISLAVCICVIHSKTVHIYHFLPSFVVLDIYLTNLRSDVKAA